MSLRQSGRVPKRTGGGKGAGLIGVSVSIPSMRFGKGDLLYEPRNPTMGRNLFHLVRLHSSSIDHNYYRRGDHRGAVFVALLLTPFDLEAS